VRVTFPEGARRGSNELAVRQDELLRKMVQIYHHFEGTCSIASAHREVLTRGEGSDPTATYSIFNFKNYVMIIS